MLAFDDLEKNDELEHAEMTQAFFDSHLSMDVTAGNPENPSTHNAEAFNSCVKTPHPPCASDSEASSNLAMTEARLIQQIKKELRRHMPEIAEFDLYGYNYCARLDQAALAQLHAKVQQAQNNAMPAVSAALVTALDQFVTLAGALPTDELKLAMLVEDQPCESEQDKFYLVNSLVPFFSTLLDTLQQASELEKKDFSGEFNKKLAGEAKEIIQATLADPRCDATLDAAALEKRLYAKSQADSVEQVMFHLLTRAHSANTDLGYQLAANQLELTSAKLSEHAKKIRTYVEQQIPLDYETRAKNASRYIANETKAMLATATQVTPPVFQHTAPIETALDTLQREQPLATLPTDKAIHRRLSNNLFILLRCLAPIHSYLQHIKQQLLAQQEGSELYPLTPEALPLQKLLKPVKKNLSGDRMIKLASTMASKGKLFLSKIGSETYKGTAKLKRQINFPQHMLGLETVLEEAQLLFRDKIQLVKHRLVSLPEHTAKLVEMVKLWDEINARRKELQAIDAARSWSVLYYKIEDKLAEEEQRAKQEREKEIASLDAWLAPLQCLTQHPRMLQTAIEHLFEPYLASTGGQMTERKQAFLDALCKKADSLSVIAEKILCKAARFHSPLDEKGHERLRFELAALANQLAELKHQVKNEFAGVTDTALLKSYPRDERLARGIAELFDGLRQAYLAGQAEVAQMTRSVQFNQILLQVVKEKGVLFSNPDCTRAQHLFMRLAVALKNRDANIVYAPRSAERILASDKPVKLSLDNIASQRILSAAISMAFNGTYKLIAGPLSFTIQPLYRTGRLLYELHQTGDKFEKCQAFGEITNSPSKRRSMRRQVRTTYTKMGGSLLRVPSFITAMAYTGWRLASDKNYSVSDLLNSMTNELPTALVMRAFAAVEGNALHFCLQQALLWRGATHPAQAALKQQLLALAPETQQAEAGAWFDRYMQSTPQKEDEESNKHKPKKEENVSDDSKQPLAGTEKWLPLLNLAVFKQQFLQVTPEELHAEASKWFDSYFVQPALKDGAHALDEKGPSKEQTEKWIPLIELTTLKQRFLAFIPQERRVEASVWFDRQRAPAVVKKENSAASNNEPQPPEQWGFLLQRAEMEQATEKQERIAQAKAELAKAQQAAIEQLMREFKQQLSMDDLAFPPATPVMVQDATTDEAGTASAIKIPEQEIKQDHAIRYPRHTRSAPMLVHNEKATGGDSDTQPRSYFDDVEAHAKALKLDGLFKLIPANDSYKPEFASLCKDAIADLQAEEGGERIHLLAFYAKLREKLTYRWKMLGHSYNHVWYEKSIRYFDKKIQSYAARYPQSVKAYFNKIKGIEGLLDEVKQLIGAPKPIRVDPNEVVTIGRDHPKYSKLCDREWNKQLSGLNLPERVKKNYKLEREFTVRVMKKDDHNVRNIEVQTLRNIYRGKSMTTSPWALLGLKISDMSL